MSKELTNEEMSRMTEINARLQNIESELVPLIAQRDNLQSKGPLLNQAGKNKLNELIAQIAALESEKQVLEHEKNSILEESDNGNEPGNQSPGSQTDTTDGQQSSTDEPSMEGDSIEIEKLKNEISVLEKTNRELEDQIANLNVQLNALNENINVTADSLNKAIQEKEAQIEQNRKTIEELGLLNDELTSSNNKLRADIELKDRQIADLETLNSEFEKLHKTNKNITQAYLSLVKENQDLRDTIEKTKKNATASIAITGGALLLSILGSSKNR